jgi:phospholipase C
MLARGTVLAALLAAGVGGTVAPVLRSAGAVTADAAGTIHKIKHVVVIMQENRSFDSYFGTYPGADGIPMTHGVPAVCVHDPATNTCVRPFHDKLDHIARTTPPRTSRAGRWTALSANLMLM